MASSKKNLRSWLRISVYVLFILVGQAAAMLLGRRYFEKGGKSQWLSTLIQLIGFPVLLPFYFFFTGTTATTENTNIQTQSRFVIPLIYLGLGLLVSAHCFLDAIGLKYLPVSTYSLLCATELGFTALFSFFINKEKFTALIFNSLILLSFSSVQLVFGGENENSSHHQKIPKSKYLIGVFCTLGATGIFGLCLSLSQLASRTVLKRQDLKSVMKMIIFQSLVATVVVSTGFLVSGEWRHLKKEMDGFYAGKISYVMNLIGTAICWQIFTIGGVGLMFEVSSLFSNAVGVLGLPVVPVSAVICFGDRMDSTKIMALLTAGWGFLSFLYQSYLDWKVEIKEVRLEENV